jgi:vitamin B12 transporter
MVVAATRLSALVLLGLCVSSFAGTDSTFDQIVVTATRTPEPAGDVLASVTVIDRAQIEARQATSVQELLQGEAGIEWVNDGGLGKVTTLFMRGTQSDHVLVLIDGVKIGSATVGLSAFQYIPVEQIDHIEIVRGPRSSLYGSDALGGVIQIFTRHGSGEFTPEVSVAGGTHAARQTAGSISGSSDRISFSLSGSYQSSDGFNSCTGKAPLPDGSGGAGCFTFEPDADGYRNASASARVTSASHRCRRDRGVCPAQQGRNRLRRELRQS